MSGGNVYDFTLFKTCLICGNKLKLEHGIKINNQFICGCCEEGMVFSHCTDTHYIFYVNGLKKIWC